MKKQWYYHDLPIGALNIIRLNNGEMIFDRRFSWPIDSKNPIPPELTGNTEELVETCRLFDNMDTIESILFHLRWRYTLQIDNA
jgi:hypothetical protein